MDTIRMARSAETVDCLPQSLVEAVPDCAVSCIETFVTFNYENASCQDTSDLTFLCTRENSSGLTIGEGAVQCIVSSCTGSDQAKVEVYTICLDISGAVPETAGTITATIFSPTSTSAMESTTSIPPSVENPTTTQQVSSIIVASLSPSLSAASAPSYYQSESFSGTAFVSLSSTSLSHEASTGTATSSAIAVPGPSASRSGLATPQLVGIVVGAVGTVLLVVGLALIAACARKKRRNRQKSNRWSKPVEPTPPTSDGPKDTPPMNSLTRETRLPNRNPRQGYYAPRGPMEEKRRSFWRRSLKPEEIGVAGVSPRPAGQSSPTSLSSQGSLSKLLPALPRQALWPAPLNLEATRKRRRDTQQPVNMAAVLEEEPSKQAMVRSNQDRSFALARPPPIRTQRVVPPPLELSAASPNSYQRNIVRESPAQAERMPLTPTYDNGNVDIRFPMTSALASSSPGSGQPGPAVTEVRAWASEQSTTLSPSSNSSSGPVAGRKRFLRSPLRMVIREPRESSSTAAAQIEQHPSPNSTPTEIEEDSTPEEKNQRLEGPPQASPKFDGSRDLGAGSESPIRDPRSPQVSRPAAMSPQAQTASRTGTRVPTSRPSRDQLVRAGTSFMQTDTTSSDGYISDETMEWPAPPVPDSEHRRDGSNSRNAFKANIAKLRESPTGSARGYTPQIFGPSLDEVVATATQNARAPTPLRSPASKAKLTPSKSRTGDLYLTVEI